MRTDDLVDLLASGDVRVDRGAVTRRFGLAFLLGALGSLLLMRVVYGVRPDLASVAQTPMFWAKVAFPLVAAIGAGLAAWQLGRPGARAGWRWALAALPFVVVWASSLVVLNDAEPATRLALVLGKTWRSCPFNIALLSVPTFVAFFWAMRGLAPTRPSMAGAAAGLLASGVATIAYCLHCPEMSPAFWGVWYAIGLLMPAAIGAWLGPRLLRW